MNRSAVLHSRRTRASAWFASLLLSLLMVWGTEGAGAQTPPSDPTVQPHGSVLVGQAGTGTAVHRWLGLNAGVVHGRWGLAGEVHRGGGNGFSSMYLGAGPLIRHSVHPRLEVRVFTGIGHYREQLDRDRRSRSVTGPTAGMQFRVPAGPIVVLLGATGWLGSHQGEDTPEEAIPGRGLRLLLGVGR
ncbi:MAG: hypothetical protein EA352_05185 [Gemmatimonadales bacterium]|nr:MAG: hypothetical protein EA352_05185 [Gemmatimonadales bacterium]